MRYDLVRRLAREAFPYTLVVTGCLMAYTAIRDLWGADAARLATGIVGLATGLALAVVDGRRAP